MSLLMASDLPVRQTFVSSQILSHQLENNNYGDRYQGPNRRLRLSGRDDRAT